MESVSQTAHSQVPEITGPSRCKPSEQHGSEQSKTERVPKQTTGPVPISCTLQHTISTASKDKNLAPGDDFRDGNPANSDIGNGRGSRTRVPGDPFSLVTLNVKNMKTNMGYLQCLANIHPIILVQEHWLYGFESVIAKQVFDNSNYHIKCVDDLDPFPPIQPPRGRAGTAILWNKPLYNCITTLPDGSDRVIAVEIDVKPRKICLINVYLPTRGSADCDIAFQATLDEVHEIMEKFVSSHKILLTGDFNTSLHRQENCWRDRMLKSFEEEHGLSLPDNYPVQPTYMH